MYAEYHLHFDVARAARAGDQRHHARIIRAVLCLQQLKRRGQVAQKFPQARVGEQLPDGNAYGLILLCVRSTEIERALAPAVPRLNPDGAVVCLQNGFPEQRVAKLVGASRVLGAVIGWSVLMLLVFAPLAVRQFRRKVLG